MSNASMRELRARWYESLKCAEEYWAENKIAEADRCFRRAFNQSKQICRKSGKADLSVEITLKTITEFHRARGHHYELALYHGLIWLWYVERWLRNFRSGAKRAAGPSP